MWYIQNAANKFNLSAETSIRANKPNWQRKDEGMEIQKEEDDKGANCKVQPTVGPFSIRTTMYHTVRRYIQCTLFYPFLLFLIPAKKFCLIVSRALPTKERKGLLPPSSFLFPLTPVSSFLLSLSSFSLAFVKHLCEMMGARSKKEAPLPPSLPPSLPWAKVPVRGRRSGLSCLYCCPPTLTVKLLFTQPRPTQYMQRVQHVRVCAVERGHGNRGGGGGRDDTTPLCSCVVRPRKEIP